jgi:cytochrome c-type biogenesis protein CcmH
MTTPQAPAPSPPTQAQVQAQAGTGSGRPAAEPKSATGGMDKAVSGTVRIAPALAAQAGPDDTLFIYARAAEGSRMPLAIVKATARDLPFKFRLDDSQAMAGGASLSSVAQVRIEARISKSGQATLKPGDLRGESAAVAPGTSNIEIVIDKVAN